MMPIVTPNSGEEAGSPASRAAVSYIRDHPVLYDDLSLREHLAYPTRLHGSTPEQHEAERLIAELGVAGRQDDLPSTFSRGLRQKTAIVVATHDMGSLDQFDRAVMLSNGELVFDGPPAEVPLAVAADSRPDD